MFNGTPTQNFPVKTVPSKKPIVAVTLIHTNMSHMTLIYRSMSHMTLIIATIVNTCIYACDGAFIDTGTLSINKSLWISNFYAELLRVQFRSI